MRVGPIKSRRLMGGVGERPAKLDSLSVGGGKEDRRNLSRGWEMLSTKSSP